MILGIEELKNKLSELRKDNKDIKVVFTNGVFDILHIGHIDILRRARTLGDVLVVGINSDSSVKQIKGDKRPINKDTDRAELINSCSC